LRLHTTSELTSHQSILPPEHPKAIVCKGSGLYWARIYYTKYTQTKSQTLNKSYANGNLSWSTTIICMESGIPAQLQQSLHCLKMASEGRPEERTLEYGNTKKKHLMTHLCSVSYRYIYIEHHWLLHTPGCLSPGR